MEHYVDKLIQWKPNLCKVDEMKQQLRLINNNYSIQLHPGQTDTNSSGPDQSPLCVLQDVLEANRFNQPRPSLQNLPYSWRTGGGGWGSALDDNEETSEESLLTNSIQLPGWKLSAVNRRNLLHHQAAMLVF